MIYWLMQLLVEEEDPVQSQLSPSTILSLTYVKNCKAVNPKWFVASALSGNESFTLSGLSRVILSSNNHNVGQNNLRQVYSDLGFTEVCVESQDHSSLVHAVILQTKGFNLKQNNSFRPFRNLAIFPSSLVVTMEATWVQSQLVLVPFPENLPFLICSVSNKAVTTRFKCYRIHMLSSIAVAWLLIRNGFLSFGIWHPNIVLKAS